MVEENSNATDFDSWMKTGIENGWVGPPVCYTHDGLPMALAEEDEFERGSDPCLHILRLYFDSAHRAAVEEVHIPSQWRNTYK